MNPERILLVHNYYQQPGGEDVVFESERALLESRGHRVTVYTDHNRRVDGMSALALGRNVLWSGESRRKLAALIERERPQIAHFHNTFQLISPSAYYACREHGVPVVQTIHNYRLVCPAAICYRDGRTCEDCLSWPVPLPGVMHGCYRGSRLKSAGVASMLTLHGILGTWRKLIDRYVVLSEFSRDLLRRGGLPGEKISLKPNSVMPDPGEGERDGDYAVYAGRLSEEKGVRTLLEAWENLDVPVVKLIGGGPLEPLVRERVGAGRIELIGRMERSRLFSLMRSARMLIAPSLTYECFPMAAAEAMACGIPVVASRIGALADIVDDGRTGLLFDPGDAAGLAAQVESLHRTPGLVQEMGKAARAEYVEKYSEEADYRALSRIYEDVLEGK